MSKNEIPFIHERALKILREERELLVVDLKAVKRQINHMQFLRKNEPDDYVYFNWESIYMGDVSKLTKRQNQWRKDLKSIEESIKVLKMDAQEHHQDMWDEQQYIKEATSGSYNCLAGC